MIADATAPRTVEGLRHDLRFMLERPDAITALAFMVHRGLVQRDDDGRCVPAGPDIAPRAMAGMEALDEVTA